MGGFSLTKPGLQYPQEQAIDPTTGQPIQAMPHVQFFKNVAARAKQFAADAAAQSQPSTSTVDGSVDGQPVTGEIQPPAPVMPKMFKPSFASVSGPGPDGLPQGVSPAETKLGTLVSILGAAARGGLAGFGTGNAAAGAAAAREIPFQQAQQHAQLAQEQAQLELTKSQSQMIPTPYGAMPAGMAKLLFPALVRAGATTGAATINAGARTGAAQIGAQGRTGAAQIGAEAKIKAAQLGLGPYADVPQDLQDQFGLPAQLPLKMLNQAESAANRPLTVVQGEAGPAVVNKQQAIKGKPGPIASLGLGAPAQARPVQAAADPNNPGNISYMSAGKAERTAAAAPGSAPSITAKATAKAVAPGGKVGEEVNAFNTAIRHADLLSTAAEALHNGDQQTLNSLKNKFKNEFGSTEPITANTIAGAYTREVTKMLSGNHMTDSEIGTVGSTLDPNRQSLPQMMGVINAYKALAGSKMQVRREAVEQGMKGKANFPAQNAPASDFFSTMGGKPR